MVIGDIIAKYYAMQKDGCIISWTINLKSAIWQIGKTFRNKKCLSLTALIQMIG